MINCIIVDDEQHAIDLLAIHIKQTSFIDLKRTFLNPLDAISYLNSGSGEAIDLLFLDINMPALSGLDFIGLLKGKYRIILTTAYKEFALESYEYNVTDFLLKPVLFNRFLRSVLKVQESLNASEKNISVSTEKEYSDFFFIKSDHKGKHLKISFDDIDYIESMKNYVAIHSGKTKTLALMTLKNLEEILPKRKFIRVHHSYIIPIEKISMIEGNLISLKGVEATIPVGTTYKENVFQLLNISRTTGATDK